MQLYFVIRGSLKCSRLTNEFFNEISDDTSGPLWTRRRRQRLYLCSDAFEKDIRIGNEDKLG